MDGRDDGIVPPCHKGVANRDLVMRALAHSVMCLALARFGDVLFDYRFGVSSLAFSERVP